MAEGNWFDNVVKGASSIYGNTRGAVRYGQNAIGDAVGGAFARPTKAFNALTDVKGLSKGFTDGPRQSSMKPGASSAEEARQTALGDYGDTGEKARFGRIESQIPPQTQLDDPNAGPKGPGSRGSGLDKVFAPLFAALDQQRSNANSRYTANSGQIKNIYGQLIGARKDDVDSINTAYERLQTAASTRGAETMAGMAGRESDRVSDNQAVLQSMGVGDLGTAGNDVASDSAQAAQNTEAANQSNYSGQLDMMNATSQEIARADATSFGYRQGEDIAQLQGAKEDYLQGVDQQEFGLKSQKIQAEQEYQQAQQRAALAAIAAQQKAQQDAQKQASKDQQAQFEMGLDYLKNAPPIDRSIGEETSYTGVEVDSVKVKGAYNKWLTESAPEMGRMGNATPVTAYADLINNGYGDQLSSNELRILQRAILYTFENQ